MGYGNILAANMPRHPVYLWTLPMFHCNGWCFPVVAVGGGGHACLPALGAREGDLRCHRRAQGHASLRRADRDVHLDQCASRTSAAPLPHTVEFITAAAPPPEAVLAGDGGCGFQRHACLRPDRNLRPRRGERVERRSGRRWSAAPRAAKKARQGVRYHALDALTVMDPGDDGAGAGRRRNAGRGHVPRQHRDEGLPEESRRRRRKRSPAAGSIPAISA